MNEAHARRIAEHKEAYEARKRYQEAKRRSEVMGEMLKLAWLYWSITPNMGPDEFEPLYAKHPVEGCSSFTEWRDEVLITENYNLVPSIASYL